MDVDIHQDFAPTVLTQERWRRAEREHRARIQNLLGGYLERRKRGVKQPTIDFLFQYYRLRPRRLLQWSPGFGVRLVGEAAKAFLRLPGFCATGDGVALSPSALPKRRRQTLGWLEDLLRATAEHTPSFGCYCMHEWAMVYRTDEIRHAQLGLRVAPDTVAAVVEETGVRCSHYDAFRFFTSAARPLNQLNPTQETMRAHEQPGCLHANMDLYRWAWKLYPWCSGELLADAFSTAMRARALDMRASPYDLSEDGVEPILVETIEGKRAFVAAQRALAEDAALVRKQLIDALAGLRAWLGRFASIGPEASEHADLTSSSTHRGQRTE